MIEYQVSYPTTEERHFFTSGYFQITRKKVYSMHGKLLFFSCFGRSKHFCVYHGQRLYRQQFIINISCLIGHILKAEDFSGF